MLVEARAVVVEYAGRRVLDGVDLAVDTGDQIAITGRSGSGKTTLLLVLAGLLVPTAGRLRLDGDPRTVVYVPQAPSLIDELTALDNVALPLRVRGVDPTSAVARARELMELLGIGAAVDALPAELSGGMQQRVALARGLAVRPRLLLADEPTGTLDAATGAHILDVLREVAARDTTALVVATHDQVVAAQLHRQVALTDGRSAA